MELFKKLKSGVESMKERGNDNTYKNRLQAEKLKEKQELHEEREKGRRKGAMERAYKEGKQAGSRNGSGWGGTLNAIGAGLQSTEKVFGFSNGVQMGGGLDFGFGSSSPAPKKPAAKTTRIVTGGKTITIRDNTPIEPVKKVRGGSNWMEDLDRDSIF
jgi:hypothetical protein